MKEVVTVARSWGNPQIIAHVSTEEVGAKMELEAFLKALAIEVGNPTTLVTVAALHKRLVAASAEVLAEMKSSTRYL